MKISTYILSIGMALGVSTAAQAYDPFPMSPTWIKTTFSAIEIAQSPIFRGKVIMINGQNSVLVEREDGSQMTVNLFHTHVTGSETQKQLNRQKDALEGLVGFNWYIRGDQSKNNIEGIFLTKDGENANMLLVYAGIYDLNTRSIIYSYDKKHIQNKYKYIQGNNLNPK